MSRHARDHRLTRKHWMLIAFAPGGLVAGVCFVQAAWWGMVKDHGKWDDFLLVGFVWFLSALGAALLLRVLWALIIPERWLPRWLAAALLAVAIFTALLALFYFWYASSWGP